MSRQTRSEQERGRKMNEFYRAHGYLAVGDRVVTEDGRRNGVVRKLRVRGIDRWARVKFDVEPEPLWVPVSILKRVD